MKLGARLDAIIRTVEDDYYEYGGMEVARTFNGVTSTKWLGDEFKLVRAMRDMLFRLHELVGGERGTRLQVVGVTTAGLRCQWARLGCRAGYVCLLDKERMGIVPMAVGGLHELLKLLMSVAQMKQVIKDCVIAVEGRHSTKSEAELFLELVGEPTGGNSNGSGNGDNGDDTKSREETHSGRNQEPKSKSKLSWTIDTP